MLKRQKGVSFGLVFVGLVFFFEPCIGLFDLLPDVIGALLLYVGLKKAADAGSYFDDARKLSFYMLLLYALKAVLAFSLLRYPDNALPYTFMAGVLEVWVLIRFFGRLYDGFEYAAMRSGDGKSALAVKNVRTVSYLLACVRPLMAFLPEILEFVQQTDDLDLSAGASYRMPIIRLKPYAILLCALVSLMVGILFLVYTRAFFRKVKKDEALRAYLTENYQSTHRHDRARYAGRAVGASSLWLCAAAVFTADFTVDGYDVLIDLVAVLCLALAFYALHAFDGRTTPRVKVGLYGVGCLLSFGAQLAVRPTVFALLNGDYGKKELFGAEWLAGGSAPMQTLIGGILYLLCVAPAFWAWKKRAEDFCRAEGLGDVSAKVTGTAVLSSAVVLCKGIGFVLDIERAHLATVPEVTSYISARTHMNLTRQNEVLAANPAAAQFERLDGLAPLVTVLTLALVLFTVFSLLSLRAYVSRRTDPNAE